MGASQGITTTSILTMAKYGNNMYAGDEVEAEFMQSNGFCDTFHVVEEAENSGFAGVAVDHINQYSFSKL